MYKFNADGSVRRLSDGLNIPAVEGNADFIDVMDWVERGNTIAPAEVVTVSLDQLKESAIQLVREVRKAAFATLAGLQSEATARGNAVKALAIADVQQLLKDLPQTDLSGCENEADIKDAFKLAWYHIGVAAVAAGIKNEFEDLA